METRTVIEADGTVWQRPLQWEEMGDGLLVFKPIPDNQHQAVVTDLCCILHEVIAYSGRGEVFPGVNVSNLAEAWLDNYRIPDVAVYLSGNSAVDRETHFQGGPDFAVEVISPGEDPHAKLGFYAKANTRELLVIHRKPWALELFVLADGVLRLAGRCDMAGGGPLASAVLPFTFRVVPGEARPEVEVSHGPTRRTWRV